MATIYDGGLAKAHDSQFGINHKNIASKLTENNWSKKAIVRGGLYIFIHKYIKYNSNNPEKKIIVYKIKGLPDGHKCKKDYFILKWIIKAANNLSNGNEGLLPKERHQTIKISKVYMSKNN